MYQHLIFLKKKIAEGLHLDPTLYQHLMQEGREARIWAPVLIRAHVDDQQASSLRPLTLVA
jgi:hypothetical protein